MGGDGGHTPSTAPTPIPGLGPDLAASGRARGEVGWSGAARLVSRPTLPGNLEILVTRLSQNFSRRVGSLRAG